MKLWSVTLCYLNTLNLPNLTKGTWSWSDPTKMTLVSPPEKVDLREVLIIRFHTYLSFRAWLFSALTYSISARQRWAESDFLRTTIIRKVFKGLGMTKKENVSNNLRSHRIRNDHADLNNVIAIIQKTMNPFDVNLDPDKL